MPRNVPSDSPSRLPAGYDWGHVRTANKARWTDLLAQEPVPKILDHRGCIAAGVLRSELWAGLLVSSGQIQRASRLEPYSGVVRLPTDWPAHRKRTEANQRRYRLVGRTWATKTGIQITATLTYVSPITPIRYWRDRQRHAVSHSRLPARSRRDLWGSLASSTTSGIVPIENTGHPQPILPGGNKLQVLGSP